MEQTEVSARNFSLIPIYTNNDGRNCNNEKVTNIYTGLHAQSSVGKGLGRCTFENLGPRGFKSKSRVETRIDYEISGDRQEGR